MALNKILENHSSQIQTSTVFAQKCCSCYIQSWPHRWLWIYTSKEQEIVRFLLEKQQQYGILIVVTPSLNNDLIHALTDLYTCTQRKQYSKFYAGKVQWWWYCILNSSLLCSQEKVTCKLKYVLHASLCHFRQWNCIPSFCIVADVYGCFFSKDTKNVTWG